MNATATKKYEDFEPSTEIVQEKDSDTILLYVPGFKKEKLRVQLTSTKVLRISGEKEIEDNKSIRFQKDFPVSSNYDTNKITAKFERGILYVRQPKLITPEDKPDIELPVPPQPPTPQKPADKPQPQKVANEPQPQKNVHQETGEKTSPRDGSSKQAAFQDVSQKKLEKEEPMARTEKSSESTDSKSLGKKIEEENRKNDAIKAADKVDKGSSENVDGRGKTRLKNYKGNALDLAAKVKMSRRVFTVVLVVLLVAALGLYVTNFIRSFRTSEILE